MAFFPVEFHTEKFRVGSRNSLPGGGGVSGSPKTDKQKKTSRVSGFLKRQVRCNCHTDKQNITSEGV